MNKIIFSILISISVLKAQVPTDTKLQDDARISQKKILSFILAAVTGVVSVTSLKIVF